MVEFASIIILGIAAQWISWRYRVPAILPLIIIGLLVGPISTLWTESGHKFIEPIFRDGHGLFPGESLFYFVSLAIGIILFEGGLTLNIREFKSVGLSITRLILIGSLITFIGGGISVHFLLGLSWKISFLFAGLIIVTGPTVIAPILRNIPLTKNVSTVLKWEGILIDPLGALVAVLVFEFIISGGEEFTQHALLQFGKIIIVGLCIGFTFAYALYYAIKYELLPRYLLNVATLALVLTVFVISDLFATESGLLSVVIMGMVIGNLDMPGFKHILDFKESLSILLISILFILLAANINLEDLYILENWNCLILFGIIILILRPLGVFLSTIGGQFNFPEKIFISWVGPRGIVAAGIASLFGLKLANDGVPGAEYITPLVFMVVLGTVLLNATTARFLAIKLGVIMESSDGILIIGSNVASRMVAKFLKDKGRHVVIIDNNANSIQKAKDIGVEAFQANIYTDDLNDHFELLDMGYLIAMTSNVEVNQYAMDHFRSTFGERGTYRLSIPQKHQEVKLDDPDNVFSAEYVDFLQINEIARDFPQIHQIKLDGPTHYKEFLQKIQTSKTRIPLFLEKDNKLIIIYPNLDLDMITKNDSLYYLGEEFNSELQNP